MPKTPNYPVPALEKGLDIVETLAAAAVPQSLAELADALDRSSSELFRMLNCLERRGYVKRDGSSGKYALTLRLYNPDPSIVADLGAVALPRIVQERCS